jgi:DNA-binding response OmpR family regulator
VGDLQIDHLRGRVTLAGARLALTPREYAVLATLASEPGRTFTKAELRLRCWSHSPPPAGGRGLETQICRLRRRLGAHAPLLVTVWSVGYRLHDVR